MFLNMIFKIHFPITCLRLTFGETIYGIGRHVIIGTQTFRLANDIITWTAWTKADRDGININLCWEVNIFAACLDELSHTEQSFVFMINFFQTCIISLLSGCNIGTGPSPHHWARWHCILSSVFTERLFPVTVGKLVFTPSADRNNENLNFAVIFAHLITYYIALCVWHFSGEFSFHNFERCQTSSRTWM